MRQKEQWLAFLLVLPSFLAVAIFVYGFIGWTGAVSFHGMEYPRPPIGPGRG